MRFHQAFQPNQHPNIPLGAEPQEKLGSLSFHQVPGLRGSCRARVDDGIATKSGLDQQPYLAATNQLILKVSNEDVRELLSMKYFLKKIQVLAQADQNSMLGRGLTELVSYEIEQT
tara:strand:- start:281 stop:628 length:348 start_codon:yes stop_codon:yes gene_type:complete